MHQQVLEIIAKSSNLDLERLQKDSDSKDLWDSFSKVDIVLNLETALGIEFSDEEMSKMNSVSEILKIVEFKMG